MSEVIPAVKAEVAKQDSAPVVKVETATPPAVTVPAQPEVKADKFVMPKGLAAELHKIREDRAKAREENEALKKALEDAKHPTTAAAVEVPSFIEDPDKRFAMERERMKSDIMTSIRTERETIARQQYIDEQGAKAIDFLLTQPEVNGDMDKLKEVDAMLTSDPELSAVFKVSPRFATEKAFENWKKSKGMDASQTAAATAAIAASATAKANPSTTVSNRTRADILKDFTRLHPNAPDYQKKWESLTKELTSTPN